MAVTGAISAFGTLLKRGNGATPETFTTVGEVRNITGPNLKLDTEDVTNHDSTGGWAEVIPTILHGGDIKFDVNYKPTDATHNATVGVIADMTARTRRNWQLVFPTPAPTTWAFAAFVESFNPKEPVKGELSASIGLQVTGQPTLV